MLKTGYLWIVVQSGFTENKWGICKKLKSSDVIRQKHDIKSGIQHMKS